MMNNPNDERVPSPPAYLSPGHFVGGDETGCQPGAAPPQAPPQIVRLNISKPQFHQMRAILTGSKDVSDHQPPAWTEYSNSLFDCFLSTDTTFDVMNSDV